MLSYTQNDNLTEEIMFVLRRHVLDGSPFRIKIQSEANYRGFKYGGFVSATLFTSVTDVLMFSS